jgi:hypothetical protein
MSPFDVVKAINETKEDLFVDPQAEKDYAPFIINRSLSFFPDTILYANEMNRYSNIPRKSQFQYYLNSIPKRKRYSKWYKKDTETKSLALVMEYYNYSSEKAKEALKVLSDDQVKLIEQKLEKGSRK